VNIDDKVYNPGQRLQDFFKRLYPFDPDDKKSAIAKIDNALLADTQFSELVYNSSINYMVRRFIATAQFLKRKYNTPDYPSERYFIELRRFLIDYTQIPKNEIELLHTLLMECVNVAARGPNKTTIKQILREAKELGARCYICGCELVFDDPNSPRRPEVEHIWPNSMGGMNESSNLKVSCHSCNQHKKSYIDSSDFHYEEICLTTDKDEETFWQQLTGDYRVALWAKHNYSCATCEEPASLLGGLVFARREPNDSWHFLNIDAYCAKDIPKHDK